MVESTEEPALSRRPSVLRQTMQSVPVQNNKPFQPGINYVKKFMKEDYSDECFKMSTSLDILAVYLKAQKILYTESKVYCEQQLNMLMLPAISISTMCTILSVALQGLTPGPYVVSGLAAVNSFILAIVSYLKLDAKAEAHKTTAYQYSQLLTMCEFNSGKFMFFNEESKSGNSEHTGITINEQKTPEDKLKDILENVQTKIEEIQDTNKFMLPQYIRYNLRSLNETNLFSKVKQLQLLELDLMNTLKSDLRKVHEKQIKFVDSNYELDLVKLAETPDDNEEKREYMKRVQDKENTIKSIFEHRKKYLELEESFKKEIDNYINKSKNGCFRCNWLKS